MKRPRYIVCGEESDVEWRMTAYFIVYEDGETIQILKNGEQFGASFKMTEQEYNDGINAKKWKSVSEEELALLI